jgi:hypothetical protein
MANKEQRERLFGMRTSLPCEPSRGHPMNGRPSSQVRSRKSAASTLVSRGGALSPSRLLSGW